MGSEWPTIPLGQLIEPGRALTYGVVQPGPPVADGVPIVRVADIRNGRVSTTPALRISPAIEAPYGRSRLRGGELLLTVVGTVGETVVVPDALAGWNTARGVAVIPVRNDVGSMWVRLALQGLEARAAIDSRLNTTVQATLNLDDVARLPIPMPPTEERQRILRHVGAFDDKIELNRRMSQTLESMARALFKSWFIDFDPVRAKADGRDPGLPDTVSELFPAAFVGSDLGDIPSDWHIGRLGDVLDQRVERCTPSAETASRPYVPIECISPRSLALVESRPGAEAQSSLIKFHKGDLLFGAMRPYFHKVCIAPFDGTTRSTAFVLHPRLNGDFAFASFLLHDAETIDYATQHATGSTIPYAVWEGSLKDMPIVLPSAEIRSAFDVVARPLLARLQEPYFQDQALTSARETLLLALLSGHSRPPSNLTTSGGSRPCV